jgi:hypothetical protein
MVGFKQGSSFNSATQTSAFTAESKQNLGDEFHFEEEEDYNNPQNTRQLLKYAMLAALLAVGTKMDEFGQCLFTMGPKVRNS